MGKGTSSNPWYERGWVWIVVIIIPIGLWYGWRWYHTRISPYTPQASSYDCPVDKPIKGNAQSGIYHVPGGASYGRTKAEKCFATESDALSAGYRASKR